MLVQALTEVKIELLKNHDFLPWRNFVTLSCNWREDGSHARDQHALTHTVQFVQ